MMVVESFLLRAKKQRDRWSRSRAVQRLGVAVGCFGGGFVLSGLRVWGQMQPVAIGLTAASSGWRSCLAAAGSAAGYRFFFGAEGMQGMLWSLGALLLILAAGYLAGDPSGYLATVCMAMVAALGVWEKLPAEQLVLRSLLAAGSVLLFRQAAEKKDVLSRWLAAGVGVMAVSGVCPWLGRMLAGAAAEALPLPAAAAVGLGADLGTESSVSLAAVSCICFFLQRRFPREGWRRLISPGIGCCLLLALRQRWDPMLLLWVSAGGLLGALVPWRYTVVPRRSRVGAAQVRLEQTAQVFGQFQRQLLAYSPPAPDLPAVTEQLKKVTCGGCSAREDCLERKRMEPSILTEEATFLCRRSGAVALELDRSREQLRRMKASRAKQESCRMALVQQYGYLSDMLRSLSDALPQRDDPPRSRYRVRVSARSAGKELADGDRAAAFPGVCCRYYVLLCDGMGTGMGASEESREVAALIRRMLTAGLTPEAALGSVNSQLALTDRGGAVTIDLAELRLDTGRAMLYRWGAGQSWLLRRRKCIPLGASGPPPGLGVTEGREHVSRAELSRGETLLMLSDGVACAKAKQWAEFAENMEPGALAKQILEDGGSREDDATAVVVRLERKISRSG